MCLDCGEVRDFEGDVHHLCPTPHKPEQIGLVPVRIEECPAHGSDKRTKRYRDNVCDSEHHHYGRGDHVVILSSGENYALAMGLHADSNSADGGNRG